MAGLFALRGRCSRRRGVGAVALAATLLGLAVVPGSAQYVGRNKVQYAAFHFDVYFYPAERAAAAGA